MISDSVLKVQIYNTYNARGYVVCDRSGAVIREGFLSYTEAELWATSEGYFV